jgi:high-affinity Fe2+/Pb2+ permease
VISLNLSDSFFNKIERKTNVKKSSIMNLAKKLQGNNMKDEKTLREVIRELSSMTGKEVSKEQEDKIISTVVNDKVPNNIDKMF